MNGIKDAAVIAFHGESFPADPNIPDVPLLINPAPLPKLPPKLTPGFPTANCFQPPKFFKFKILEGVFSLFNNEPPAPPNPGIPPNHVPNP